MGDRMFGDHAEERLYKHPVFSFGHDQGATCRQRRENRGEGAVEVKRRHAQATCGWAETECRGSAAHKRAQRPVRDAHTLGGACRPRGINDVGVGGQVAGAGRGWAGGPQEVGDRDRLCPQAPVKSGPWPPLTMSLAPQSSTIRPARAGGSPAARGAQIAPNHQQASAAVTHAAELPRFRATRSPALVPAACSPAARSFTSRPFLPVPQCRWPTGHSVPPAESRKGWVQHLPAGSSGP